MVDCKSGTCRSKWLVALFPRTSHLCGVKSLLRQEWHWVTNADPLSTPTLSGPCSVVRSTAFEGLQSETVGAVLAEPKASWHGRLAQEQVAVEAWVSENRRSGFSENRRSSFLFHQAHAKPNMRCSPQKHSASDSGPTLLQALACLKAHTNVSCRSQVGNNKRAAVSN